MITDGARGFSDQAAIPVIGVQSVADLDVLDAVLRMTKETAVTDDCVIVADGHGPLAVRTRHKSPNMATAVRERRGDFPGRGLGDYERNITANVGFLLDPDEIALGREVERRIPISERRVERALENLRRAGFKV